MMIPNRTMGMANETTRIARPFFRSYSFLMNTLSLYLKKVSIFDFQRMQVEKNDKSNDLMSPLQMNLSLKPYSFPKIFFLNFMNTRATKRVRVSTAIATRIARMYT